MKDGMIITYHRICLAVHFHTICDLVLLLGRKHYCPAIGLIAACAIALQNTR